MRLALLIVVLAVAGCLRSIRPPEVEPPIGVGTGGWALDCTLGQHERDLGGEWPQDCLARASHTPGDKAELWLAVNPNDADSVVIGAKDLNPASSAQCVWNGVSVTHDGGASWGDVVIGGTYDSRTPESPYFGYACNTDPMLAWSHDGHAVHYVVEMYNLGGTDSHGPLGPDPMVGRPLLLPGWKLVLATSTDGGDTWPTATLLLQGEGGAAINDYSRVIISPATGTILTAINTFSGGPFFLASALYTFCTTIASRDGGASAEAPVVVHGLARAAEDASGSFGCRAVAASPEGTVVLGGASGVAEGAQTMWAWSTDDGRSFSTPLPGFTYTPIPGIFDESEYRTGTNFELAYDLTAGPRHGTLYLIYADAGAGDADIYVRSSADDGRTWGEPARVSDDATGHHQFMPNLAVAEDGSLHAFFMDKRWDPANKLIDITHAISLDGGLTWANERVTNVSWDGDLGTHQEGFPFIGDYIGIGASGGVVWGAFPDGTLGDPTVVAAARVVRP